MTLSIAGDDDDDDWMVFSKTAQSGNKLLFRSRTRSPEVQAFASVNPMMRLRCVLADGEVGEGGMPSSTADLDDYEDRLLGALKAADAEAYLIAVVTGDGNRDLFFTARDLDDLRAGIKAAQTDIATFKLQIAPIADSPAFLKMLTLSVEQEQAAMAAGRVHGVSSGSGGGLLGKLFGR